MPLPRGNDFLLECWSGPFLMGAIFGWSAGLWALVGMIFGSLGASWEPLEASWESLESLLGASWEPPGRFGASGDGVGG